MLDLPNDLSISDFLRRGSLPSILAPMIPSAADHAVKPADKEYVHGLHRDGEVVNAMRDAEGHRRW